MNYQELEAYLYSNHTVSTVDENTVFQHFILNHDIVPYNNEYLTILGSDRDFHGVNHIISVHERNCPKIPMHIYHYIKINYVYHGNITIQLEDKKIALNKGDLIIIDKHVPHEILPTSMDDILINIILKVEFFSESFINNLPEESILSKFLKQLLGKKGIHTHYLICNTKNNQLVHQCVQNILCEHLDTQICSSELIDRYISILITHLIRCFGFDTNYHSQKKNEELLQSILNYIKNNYVRGNLNDMCNHLGYTSVYICNFIKQQTGETFKKLVFEERLKKSTIFLLNTNYPVYEISELVGFNNLTSFYKQFQKRYHCTPNEFRSNRDASSIKSN